MTLINKNWLFHIVLGILPILMVNCKKENDIITSAIPIVVTDSIIEISRISATCLSFLVSDGGLEVTSKGVCWSTHKTPTLNDSKIEDTLAISSFKCSISGLIPDSIYYVRAYAINSAGLGYGNEVLFRTKDLCDKKTFIRAYLDRENNITEYDYLDSLKNIIKTTKIFYSDSLIIKLSNDEYSRYYLNNDDFIGLIIDSSAYGIETINAEYNEYGNLKSFVYNYKNNQNIINLSYNEDYYFISYAIVYSYDTTNLIDYIINPASFLYLKNMGNQNKKLVKKIKYGANGGSPGTVSDISEYKYKLDINGFVIERTERYSPSHKWDVELDENSQIYYITNFEYIKNNAP